MSQLIGDMIDIMESQEYPEAVGLAAPQLGENLKLYLVRTIIPPIDINDKSTTKTRVFINPKIEKKFGSTYKEVEGCLSLPGITVNVMRHSHILISYHDQYWMKRKEVFKGFTARVIQHEQDHLNGKLITDYGSPIHRPTDQEA